AIYVFDEARSEWVLEAARNMSDEFIAAVRAHPVRLRETVVGQCAARREAVQIEDITKAASHWVLDVVVKMGVRIGDRGAQRTPLPRGRGQAPPARDRQPAQVAVRRQHEP